MGGEDAVVVDVVVVGEGVLLVVEEEGEVMVMVVVSLVGLTGATGVADSVVGEMMTVLVCVTVIWLALSTTVMVSVCTETEGCTTTVLVEVLVLWPATLVVPVNTHPTPWHAYPGIQHPPFGLPGQEL